MDRLAYDILLTLRCRRRYCPNSSCLAADIGQRPSYPATSCPTPLISPKRRNSMLKWVYRVWKFRTLRERERERDVVVMNFWAVVVLFFMVMIFWLKEFLWGWFFGLLWFFFFFFFFWDDLWWYVYHCNGGEWVFGSDLSVENRERSFGFGEIK